MERYKNASSDSGVVAFETGPDWIKVQFKSGEIYKYSYRRAGKQHVDEMIEQAKQGTGLSAYIATNVKELYD